METEDHLFDDFQRVDESPKRATEPLYIFRNRCAWIETAGVRELAESIYACYPADRRRDVRGRFRSENDDSHEGALLELLFFAVLGPGPVQVNSDTPDFEFQRGGDTYLLEAKSFEEHVTPERRRSKRLEDEVLDTIERELQSSHYFLSIASRGELSRPPSAASFLQPLRELLEMDPGTWSEQAPPRVEIALDDYSEGLCRLDVVLWRKGRDSPKHPIIGATGPTFRWVGADAIKWGEKLLERLRKKAGKLKARPEPSFVVVSVPSYPEVSTTSVAVRALYGISEEPKESGLPCFWRKGDRRRNSHVEGVIVCGKLLPQALDHEEMYCWLYMAPGAPEPPAPLSRLPRVHLNGDELRRQSGETLGALVRDGLGVDAWLPTPTRFEWSRLEAGRWTATSTRPSSLSPRYSCGTSSGRRLSTSAWASSWSGTTATSSS